MGKLLQGDMGVSIKRNEDVLTEIRWALPTTLELALCAIVLACLIGIPAASSLPTTATRGATCWS